MARATGVQAAAKRRRIKHERRIAEQINPLDQLGHAWSWLRSEALRVPHLLDDTVARVRAIAADLNDHESDPQKGAGQ
jgi:hypothetical protein